MQKITDKAIFTIIPGDILHIECLPNSIMTLEDGKESTRVGGELVNWQPMPMLCDLTNVIKMTHECRQHFAGEEHAKIFTMCALIITSPISRIIGNFFLGANKPLRPTRLFTKKEDGLRWLEKQSI